MDQNSSHDVLPEVSKVTLVEPTLVAEKGVVLDARREVKIKFYMGQIFMGWIWFIPTFHMPQPPPSSPPFFESPKTTVFIPRNDIDFAIGIGGAIVNAEIEMHWVVPSSALPSRLTPDVSSKSVSDPSFKVDIDEDQPTGQPDVNFDLGLSNVVPVDRALFEPLEEGGRTGLSPNSAREAVETLKD
jgi:hypothetical protein